MKINLKIVQNPIPSRADPMNLKTENKHISTTIMRKENLHSKESKFQWEMVVHPKTKMNIHTLVTQKNFTTMR